MGRLASSSAGADTSAASEDRRGIGIDTSRSSTLERGLHHSDRTSVPACGHRMRLVEVPSDRTLGVSGQGDTGLAVPEAAAAAASIVETASEDQEALFFGLGSTRLPCSSPWSACGRIRPPEVLEEAAAVASKTLKT